MSRLFHLYMLILKWYFFIEFCLSFFQDNADFFYVDVWSSRFTWAGLPPPEKGSFAIITRGQTILLDTSTPVLKMLLIQGTLWFYILLDTVFSINNTKKFFFILYCCSSFLSFFSLLLVLCDEIHFIFDFLGGMG